MIRFGVLGAGRIGQVHARAIASVPGAAFTALAEPMEGVARQVKAEYGCDLRSIDQIASSDDIDAVVICTPTDTHADLIEQFCKAGKAVFCEKPIDLDLARVRACLDVVAETNGTLMLGFQRRFDPDFNALRKAIDDGRIGEVEMVTLTSRDPGAPPLDYILLRRLRKNPSPRRRAMTACRRLPWPKRRCCRSKNAERFRSLRCWRHEGVRF